MKTVLSTLDSFVDASDWMAGEQPTLADFSILSNLIVILVKIEFERRSSLPLKYFNYVPVLWHSLRQFPEPEVVVRALQVPEGLRRELRRRRNGAGAAQDERSATCLARLR